MTVPQWLGHKHDWVMSLQVLHCQISKRLGKYGIAFSLVLCPGCSLIISYPQHKQSHKSGPARCNYTGMLLRPLESPFLLVQVGETIPAKYEQAYLENLIRHARHGIVLTWTPPRPYGEASGHGNAKSASDVIEAMRQRGFVHDIAMGARLSVGTEAEGTPLMVFWNKNIQRT